jgi:hypothetical protein
MRLCEKLSICLEMIVRNLDVFLFKQPFFPFVPTANRSRQLRKREVGIPLNDEVYRSQNLKGKVGRKAFEQYHQLFQPHFILQGKLGCNIFLNLPALAVVEVKRLKRFGLPLLHTARHTPTGGDLSSN